MVFAARRRRAHGLDLAAAQMAQLGASTTCATGCAASPTSATAEVLRGRKELLAGVPGARARADGPARCWPASCRGSTRRCSTRSTRHQDAGPRRPSSSAPPATSWSSSLARVLGMDGGIGTRYEVDADGRFTGELDGPFVYGEGKVEAMRRFAAEHDIDLAESYAYSDSVSDLPMLRAVGNPVVVNPDPDAARDRPRRRAGEMLRFERLGRRWRRGRGTALAACRRRQLCSPRARRSQPQPAAVACAADSALIRAASQPAFARSQPLECARTMASRARGAARAPTSGARMSTSGSAEREALFETISGEPIKPLYTEEDRAGADPEREIGCPGEFPFTRGVYPSMYRGRLWTMRQFAGFGTAEETNERFRYLLDHGQTGLSTAFDMPTLMGYDSDDARSARRGRACGASRSTRLDDMETLFDGIPLDEVTDSMTINAPGARSCSPSTSSRPRSRASPPSKLGGTIQNDILKEYIAQKEWCFPIEPAMRLVTRHDRVVHARDAALAPDLDLRLPHPRGRLDRRAGARLHAQGRLHLRRARRSSAASTSTTSRRGCPSSSTPTSTSSRRSPSTARPAGSGRAR